MAHNGRNPARWIAAVVRRITAIGCGFGCFGCYPCMNSRSGGLAFSAAYDPEQSLRANLFCDRLKQDRRDAFSQIEVSDTTVVKMSKQKQPPAMVLGCGRSGKSIFW